MTIVKTIIIILFFGSISIAQHPADTAEIRNNVLSVMERQVAGWNSGSIETFMDGYERSDSLRFASGGSVTYGWNTMLERYRRSYSSAEKMGTLEFSDIAVTLLSPSAALVFGTWTLHTTRRPDCSLWYSGRAKMAGGSFTTIRPRQMKKIKILFPLLSEI